MSVVARPEQGCGHELRPGAQFCTVCGRQAADDARRTGLAAGEQVPVPSAVMPHHGGTTPHQGRRPRSRWPWVAGAVALLAAGGAAAAVFIGQPSHHGHAVAGAFRAAAPVAGQPESASAAPALPSQSAPALPSQSAPALPSRSAQQRAAEGLAGLLAHSATDRSSIANAATSVSQCGPTLSQDPQVFESAATARQRLLSQLASLPGRSALSGQMLRALTRAWLASVTADRDFARWARDELSQGCTRNDQADPGFQAAAGPDDQATAGKKAFVSLWNPMAAQYGLPSYRWNQL